VQAIPFAGELAAAGTVLCWTASALLFGAASRRIGSLTVNNVSLRALLGTLVAIAGVVLLVANHA
jgi:hypothetical protein